MRIESKVHLEVIRIAAEETLQFITGKTFSDYRGDRMLQVAVEREFEIIGEALKRLVQSDTDTAARIPDYQHIIGFRNRLSHEYDDIDNIVVWEIANRDLPCLHAKVLELLKEPH